MIKIGIGLDCDGVLADFTGAYLREVRAITGVDIDRTAIDQWDICKTDAFAIAARAHNVEPSQLKKLVDARVIVAGFCESIEPLPGAKESVAALAQYGDVRIITSPWDSSPTWMYERSQWLNKHFGIHRHHVMHTGEKHRVAFDLFVDDKPSHVLDWKKRWPNQLAVLMDVHHNRNAEIDRALAEAGVVRGSWADVEREASFLTMPF